MEEWRDIPGFEGYYQASNLGRVKSVFRPVYTLRQRLYVYHSHILQPKYDKYGYLVVNLSVDNVVKTRKVHRLVWLTFNGPVPSGKVINHINEDKTDNRLENLNLLSVKENNCWGTRIQRVSERQINGKKSKRVSQFSLDGSFIKKFPSTHEVERELGYKQSNIWACCSGKYKQAYGYIWKYDEEKKEAI